MTVIFLVRSMNDPESQQIRQPGDGGDDEACGEERPLGGGGGGGRGVKRYPREVKKTLVAAGFTTFNFLLTAVSLSFVHEMHPEGMEPLPDQFLDRISYQVRFRGANV